MLDLDLSPEVDELLEVMARKAGQTKSEFAVAAILEKLEDMEDYAIALGSGLISAHLDTN